MYNTTESAFRLLIQWLYSETIAINQLKDDYIPKGDDTEECDEDMSLAQLWVLANRLKIPRLQNYVIEAMYDISERTRMIPATIYYVYDNTDNRSSLRAFLVELVASELKCGGLQKNPDQFPRDFLIEFGEYLLECHKAYHLKPENGQEMFGVSKFFVPEG